MGTATESRTRPRTRPAGGAPTCNWPVLGVLWQVGVAHPDRPRLPGRLLGAQSPVSCLPGARSRGATSRPVGH